MRIVDCCNNLNSGDNQGVATVERLTEDVASTVNVTTASTAVLTANTNRRIVKIYVMSLSVPSAEIWIRYGATPATLLNSSHSLPLRYLLVIDSPQAANAISAICSIGTAQVRVSVADKL
jgi:hypothetical protein